MKCLLVLHGRVVWLGLIPLVAAGAAGTAHAMTVYDWVKGADGWWDDPAKWNPFGVPGDTDFVRIDPRGNQNSLVHYRGDMPGDNKLDTILLGANVNVGTGKAILEHAVNHRLNTDREYLGNASDGEHRQTAGVLGAWSLLIGFEAGVKGRYLMTGGEGLLHDLFIGYRGSGEVEQQAGTVTAEVLCLGFLPGSEGTYKLKGGTLTATPILLYGVGYDGLGTFQHSAGRFNAGTLRIANGPHPSMSKGTYELSGTGDLRVSGSLYVAETGEGTYTQTGGTASVSGSILIAVPLDVLADPIGRFNMQGGTLTAGAITIEGDYIQTGGDVTVTGPVQIRVGAGAPGLLELKGGTLTAQDVTATAGQYAQTAGLLDVNRFANAGASVTIKGTADCRAWYFTNGHEVRLEDGILRGPWTPFGWILCQFTNDGSLWMGGAGLTPECVGTLTNNGTFFYDSGDFTSSILIHNGIFQNNAPFSCRRLVNNSIISVDPSHPITANGSSYPSAIENNGTLTLSGNSLTVTAAPLLNNATLRGRGTINGAVQNAGVMDPKYAAGVGTTTVTGAFAQTAAGELRLEITDIGFGVAHDKLAVGGTATLAGKLTVTQTGWTPVLKQGFVVLTCAARVGLFGSLQLPTLPASMAWQAEYSDTGLTLRVGMRTRGDFDRDGDTDLNDFAHFQACFNGAGQVPAMGGCGDADFEPDGDVDLNDFAVFQVCFNGSGRPPACP